MTDRRVWLVLLVILILFLLFAGTGHTADPQLPQQPHSDTFEYSGGSLQQFNPQTIKAKSKQAIYYRLSTISGCNAGQVVSDMLLVEQEAAKVGVTLRRDDGAPHFTVFMSCGNVQVSKCGSVNTFCLPDRYPYNTDVYMSDIMYVPGATWPVITRLSIFLHEVLAHGIATWNEQYCKGDEPRGNICYGLALFTSAPNWHDVMNTGSNSRHVFEDIEFDRWERTMYTLRSCSLTGYDECTGRWYQPDGFSYDPITGIWWNPQGQPEWSPCNADALRFNLKVQSWFISGHGFFAVDRGYWSFAPGCP